MGGRGGNPDPDTEQTLSSASVEVPATSHSVVPAADVLGIRVAKLTVAEFMNWLIGELSSPRAAPLLVGYVNAWCSNLGSENAGFADVLRKCDCVYADGQAIVWASKFLGNPLPERVNAGDFVIDLLQRLNDAGLSVFLLGSRDGVAVRAASEFQQRVKGLRVAGAVSGYFSGSGDDIARQVKASGADLVLVGMGSPRQEIWMRDFASASGARAVWCVGALFEYFGGERARAPVWMRKIGLEWLFRLALEPRRLWRRYIVGNFVFVWRVFKARLTAK